MKRIALYVLGALIVAGAVYASQNSMSTSTPVVIASDQSAVAVKGAGTAGSPDTNVLSCQGVVSGTAMPVSQSSTPWSENVAQINGVTPLMGNGTTGTGSLRVTIASDQTQLTNKLLVTPDALPANQSVNVAQINGVTTLMGNGATGTGSQRVTIASDNTAFSVNAVESGTWTVQPGNTANTTAWFVGGGAADGATVAGPPVPIGHKAIADAAAPTQVTAGQVGYGIATLERIPIFTDRHPNHIQCQQTVSTATTLTALGGSCAAPGAGLSIYITDIDFGTNAAGIAADSFNTLKSGTGGTCGAATAVIWQCMTAAATQATCTAHLKSPIKVTANSEVCWINSTAGSKVINIEGYIAP